MNFFQVSFANSKIFLTMKDIALKTTSISHLVKKRTFYSHLFMKRATIYNYQQQIIAAGRSTHSTMVFQQGFWIGAEIR